MTLLTTGRGPPWMVTIFSPPGHPIWLGWAWWKPSKDWTIGCPENPPVMVECRTFKNHVYFFVSWAGALQILRSNHQQTNIFIWTSKLSEKKYWFGRLSHLLFLNIWVWLKMRGAGREVCSLPQGGLFRQSRTSQPYLKVITPKKYNTICLYTTALEEFHSTHLCISILHHIYIYIIYIYIACIPESSKCLKFETLHPPKTDRGN